jgi:hypothetical protein
MYQNNDKCGEKANLKKSFFSRPTNQHPFSISQVFFAPEGIEMSHACIPMKP